MGCRMSLKVHMLDSYLEGFKENLGTFSDEQGKKFQDIQKFEERYHGQYNERTMGDYIWSLIR